MSSSLLQKIMIGSLGIVVGFSLAYLIPKQSSPNKSEVYSTPQEQSIKTQKIEPSPPPVEQLKGLRGIVEKNTENRLSIKELEKNSLPGSKILEVIINENTIIRYIKPTTKDSFQKAAIDQSPPSIKNIKEGMYVFILFYGDSAPLQTITANQVMYSEKIPIE